MVILMVAMTPEIKCLRLLLAVARVIAGIEIKFLRSSYFPCFWPVVVQFGPTSDSANLAKFPAKGTPRPCQAWGR